MVQESLDEDHTEKAPIVALVGTTAAIAVFGMAQGLSYPLLTLIMQRQGLGPATIGLSTAMMPLGLITSSLLAPALVSRFGARRLGVFSAVLAALLFAAIGALQDMIAWFGLRFLLGFAINPLFILSEVSVMTLAPPGRRGRIMGYFNAMTGLGYATGPIVLGTLGSIGWPPFLAGIAGFAACALILALTAVELPGGAGEHGRTSGVIGFWLVAPALLTAVTASAATQQSVYSLFPVFASGLGQSEGRIAAMVTALSLGNILLQVPLGHMAERFGARAMILACAMATGSGAVMAPFLIDSPAIWPLLMGLGGFGYGVYTMALLGLASRFSGSALITGNSAFALMWGVGGIAGPPLSGVIMEGIGPYGLPSFMAATSLLLAAVLILRGVRQRP